jgi:hypothetical protein
MSSHLEERLVDRKKEECPASREGIVFRHLERRGIKKAEGKLFSLTNGRSIIMVGMTVRSSAGGGGG